jgi:FimV-like protein
MLARQEPARAVTFLKKGLAELPDDAVLRFSLGNAHLAAKDYEAALAAYEAVLAKQPDSKMAANNVAAIIADHKYSDAKSLDRALQLAQAQRDSEIPYFLDTLGWVHYRRGDYNLAIVFLKQAVDALPTHAYMNYHLAMAYHKSGDRDSARTHLEKAVAKGASYPELDKARELLKSMM